MTNLGDRLYTAQGGRVSLFEKIYDALVQLGVSERAKQEELAFVLHEREQELAQIDNQIIQELSRGNVLMKDGFVRQRARHEQLIQEFLSRPRLSAKARLSRKPVGSIDLA